MRHAIVMGLVAGLGATASHAAVSLVSQQRAISALTTFDANTVAAAAPDFAPFVTTVTSTVAFPIGGGGTNFNVASTTINCTVDPNDIRASGVLQAAGGVALVGGVPTTVDGEAGVLIVVTFDVTIPTPFRLTAAPRPSTDPRDEFELELSEDTGLVEIIHLRETDPAQHVDLVGLLQPGRYTLQYHLEYTQSGAVQTAEYGVTLLVPAPGAGLAGVVLVGGLARRRRRV
jgi:hypothetical protein